MASGWAGLTYRDTDYLFECPKPNCYYRVTGHSHTIANHRCPFAGPTMIGWTVTKTLVQQVWDKLDAEMGIILGGLEASGAGDVFEAGDRITASKTRARAFAEVLAIFMSPHFRTADEIAKEAKRRYQAKVAGEEYETPGLGTLRFMPPPDTKPSKAQGWYPSANGQGFTSDPRQAAKKGRATPSRAAAVPTKVLSDADIQGIRNAAAMFPADQLAKVYGVTAADIEALLASD